MTTNARVNAHKVRKLQNKSWWQVINAEITHVLKHMKRLRTTRSRHTRNNDNVGNN